MAKKVLLTGSPGCGKTTLIKKVISEYSGPASGFYTLELRDSGSRVGFEIVTLDGQRGLLAHVDFSKEMRVGKYGVDLTALESVGIGAVERAVRKGWLVVIDEIGPMEIYSTGFRQVVCSAIKSDVGLLCTVVRRSTSFTDDIKRQPDITLIEVSEHNRDNLFDRIIALLNAD